MTTVKRLLAEATPLPWRQTGAPAKPHWYVSGPDTLVHGPALHRDDHVQETVDRWTADAALIVYAVNRLPDYEAAVEALERLAAGVARIHDGNPYIGTKDVRDACAVLARLRSIEVGAGGATE